MEENKTAEWYRENAKKLIYGEGVSKEGRLKGFEYLIMAFDMRDQEARLLVASMVIHGIVPPPNGCDKQEYALSILNNLAMEGYKYAEDCLNKICNTRYKQSFPNSISTNKEGPLVDFDNKKIMIDYSGVFVPVDAKLEYVNNKNVFTLSCNIQFDYGEETVIQKEQFEEAVVKGIKEWEGDYTVFDGQKLSVIINLTFENRTYDSVIVSPLTKANKEKIRKEQVDGEQNEKIKKINEAILNSGTFSILGPEWSVTSKKNIYVSSMNGEFTDYNCITNAIKHEFGHVLGLGDLYGESKAELGGVKKGTYKELDSYNLSDNLYHLVMDNGVGPVSNNDIEMVVLAFRDNEMQLFQLQQNLGKVSEALGKGN